MPFMEELHFAGTGRKFLDNMRPSRARGGSVARTLSSAELEHELSRLASLRGREALNDVRDRAREVALALDAEAEMKELDDLIGGLFGTRDVDFGTGFDSRRIELFETLQAELLRQVPAERQAQPHSLPALSFIEAYFSNWIEGTEFRLDEAEGIVFRGAMPRRRLTPKTSSICCDRAT
jgi:hypothetical protein